jgi:hypothetical protein
MDRVRVYLSSPLFVPRHEPHLPVGACILDAQVLGQQPGGLLLKVTAWYNGGGTLLHGEGRTIFVGNSKIDHVWVQEG